MRDPDRIARPTGGLLRTLRAVAASFFGVRGSREHQADITSLNPVHLIIAGVLMAALFVGTLIFIVRMVVA